MFTTPTRHKRRPNGFCQCSGTCISNAVHRKGKFGHGSIHLVISHKSLKDSATITAPIQYEVALQVLPRGLDTLHSKRTEDSRVWGCPASSCHVSSSPVLPQQVLLPVTTGGPRYPEGGFGT